MIKGSPQWTALIKEKAANHLLIYCLFLWYLLVTYMHIAKLNGRLCGAKRPHSVSEQPNFYQSLQSNPYNDSSHPSGGE